jgi:thiopurine S-methyltransferase
MELEFWHERWEKGEIGFHQHDFNRHMQEFIDRLGVQAGAHVLVPLCGKSLDMLWLTDQGYRVTGIEISELAVRDFFVENGLVYEIIDRSGVPVYRSENIDIRCADFFTVDRTDLPLVDAVYDRASLIALPPDMRLDYAGHLTSLISSGIRSLLVTLDYPQAEMPGPPFSVTAVEVEQLFSSQYRINRLHSEDCLVNEPRFRKKGLTRLDEHVFILQKNARHSL